MVRGEEIGLTPLPKLEGKGKKDEFMNYINYSYRLILNEHSKRWMTEAAKNKIVEEVRVLKNKVVSEKSRMSDSYKRLFEKSYEELFRQLEDKENEIKNHTIDDSEKESASELVAKFEVYKLLHLSVEEKKSKTKDEWDNYMNELFECYDIKNQALIDLWRDMAKRNSRSRYNLLE